MIELCGVTKKYGPRRVLGGVSLRVEKGEWMCLCGPSGCGKTTLLGVMAGVLKPDSGTVTLGSSRIGVVFQDDRLLEWKTAEENLMFALLSYYEKGEASRRAAEWLERAGLAGNGRKRPGEMSGGMKRRLNIARSLAVDPDILFLDEPFAFLDADNAGNIRSCILDMVNGRRTTVVMVTHSPDDIAGIRHRMVCVDNPYAPIALSL